MTIPSPTQRETIVRSLPTISLVVCILFGAAMILNTLPAGDGMWFWYATALLHHQRLYADLHLALQPLFVLETAATMALLGKGWLVSKLPAVLHLIAYVVALFLILRRCSLGPAQRAILLLAAFFLSICFNAYRFDDYHVLADCLQLYSILLLLNLGTPASRPVRTALLLGLLSGLALATRLNDGAALLLGVAIALLCLAPARRLLALAILLATAALTLLAVVALTGDSLSDYADYTIIQAAASKGGTGSVLAHPLQLPANTLLWLATPGHVALIVCTALLAILWALALQPSSKRLTATLIATPFLLYPLSTTLGGDQFALTFSGVASLLLYLFGLIVFTRMLRHRLRPGTTQPWDRREILFLIPLGQLASGSMSTGGFHMGLYGPIAVMILLLAICSPVKLRARWLKNALITLAALLTLSAACFKTLSPYAWHSYREQPLFTNRQLYQHPLYGPIVIDRDNLHFILEVCRMTDNQPNPPELLSLPFPYPNYFCNIPPWHGLIQTFFDTASPQTIATLITQLNTAPPRYILYQRQLKSLALHEEVFNHGKPLPHRALDQLIEDKLNHGNWKRVYTSHFDDDPIWTTEWILIQTRP